MGVQTCCWARFWSEVYLKLSQNKIGSLKPSGEGTQEGKDEGGGQGGQIGPGEGALPKEGQLCTMGGWKEKLRIRLNSAKFKFKLPVGAELGNI